MSKSGVGKTGGYKHLESKAGTKKGNAPHPANKPFGSGGAYAEEAKTQVKSKK